jgi:hypothetical protein
MRTQHKTYTVELPTRDDFPASGEGGLLYRATDTGTFYLCEPMDNTRYTPMVAGTEGLLDAPMTGALYGRCDGAWEQLQITELDGGNATAGQ